MSQQGITEAQDITSEIAWLYLVTIQIPGAPALRIVNNNEPVTSNGETFEPYPFDVVLSADDGETVPAIRLLLMHIDGTIAHAMRDFTSSPAVDIQLVLSSTPDIVERSLSGAKIRSAVYDAMGVEMDLQTFNTLGSTFPGPMYHPHEFPGLFL